MVVGSEFARKRSQDGRGIRTPVSRSELCPLVDVVEGGQEVRFRQAFNWPRTYSPMLLQELRERSHQRADSKLLPPPAPKASDIDRDLSGTGIP
jgi:hypothetical protein